MTSDCKKEKGFHMDLIPLGFAHTSPKNTLQEESIHKNKITPDLYFRSNHQVHVFCSKKMKGHAGAFRLFSKLNAECTFFFNDSLDQNCSREPHDRTYALPPRLLLNSGSVSSQIQTTSCKNTNLLVSEIFLIEHSRVAQHVGFYQPPDQVICNCPAKQKFFWPWFCPKTGNYFEKFRICNV